MHGQSKNKSISLNFDCGHLPTSPPRYVVADFQLFGSMHVGCGSVLNRSIMTTTIQHEIYPRLHNPKGGVTLESVWKWKVANANHVINLPTDYVVVHLIGPKGITVSPCVVLGG